MPTNPTALSATLLMLVFFVLPAGVNCQINPTRIIHQDKDSVVMQLFDDPGQQFSVVQFDAINQDENKSNTILTYTRSGKLVFKDSVYCMNTFIQFDDMNNDKVKDILILNTSGARSNQTYHLYLVNNTTKKLIRIKGFEAIPNPQPDTANNIIVGGALYAAKIYYTFYRITAANKLIDFKHGFEAEIGGEDNKYDKVIKLIRQRDKKTNH